MAKGYEDINNGYLTESQVNVGWSLALNMVGKSPAIANRIFDTYAHALAFAQWSDGPCIPGLILRVVSDTKENNGAYLVEQSGDTLVLTKMATGSSVESDISILRAEVSVIKTDVSTLKTDVSAIRADISTFKDKHDEDVSAIRADISTLEAKHDREVSAIHVDLSSLHDEVSTLKTEHDEDVSAINADISTLENKHIADVSSIRADISTLEAKHDSEVSAIHADISTLEAKHDSEVSAIHADLSDLGDDISALEAKHDDDVSTINADISTLREAIAALGGAFIFRGVVNTVADLPESDNKNGDVWQVTYATEDPSLVTNTEYVWVDTPSGHWVELGSIVDLTPVYQAIADLSTLHAHDCSVLTDAVNDLDAKILATDASLSETISNTATGIRADVSALEAKHDTDKSAIDASIAGLKADVSAVKADVSALEAKHDEDVSAIDASITDLDERISAIEDASAVSSVNGLVGDVSVVGDASTFSSVSVDASTVKVSNTLSTISVSETPTLSNGLITNSVLEDYLGSIIGWETITPSDE